MNYIKHLNAVFKRFSLDQRLNPTHISLYMALFQFWNMNRFVQVFFVHREELMRMSKIGSKVTYHRCLKNLSHWNYILYLPSHNPYKGSQIKMLIFCTTSETSYVPGEVQPEEQAPIPFLKKSKDNSKIKKDSSIPSRHEVLEHFSEQKWPVIHAEKFYNHYSSLGWKTAGRAKIVDWKSSAANWMIKASEFTTPIKVNNLKTRKIKDYDQPL